MQMINKQGQALGRKGEESRRRLLDATATLLANESVHKLSASKIARAASMASQSFYLYFKDIDEVLLILSTEAAIDLPDIVRILTEAPAGTDPKELSRRFIHAYSRFWDKHRPVLNARNYIADSGNIAFLKIRHEVTMPIIYAIADHIAAANPQAGLTRSDTVSRAVVIYLAMERISARSTAVQYQSVDADNAELQKAEIDVLALLFTPMEALANAVSR